MVREMICVVLKLNGYHVIAASTGDEALSICRSRNDIDLIVSDLVMPEVGGLELMSRLQEQGRKYKALLMSGYTDELGSEDKLLNESHFIQKPYNLDAFSAKVREVLDPE
jgi:CheY-like chemotaxis protein